MNSHTLRSQGLSPPCEGTRKSATTTTDAQTQLLDSPQTAGQSLTGGLGQAMHHITPMPTTRGNNLLPHLLLVPHAPINAQYCAQATWDTHRVSGMRHRHHACSSVLTSPGMRCAFDATPVLRNDKPPVLVNTGFMHSLKSCEGKV